MAGGRLVIGHGNGKNKPSLVDFVRDTQPDSFGGNEIGLLVDRLRRLEAYRLLVPGPGFEGAPREARHNGVLVRQQHTNVGGLTMRVAPKRAQFAAGHERWVVGVAYEHPVASALGKRGIGHLSAHPTPAPERLSGRSADPKVVVDYQRCMDALVQAGRLFRGLGLLLVVTGDLQMREGVDRPWSPENAVAKPLNLRVRSTHIDWIMADKALAFDGDLKIRRLFDHDGFTQALRPR